MNVRVRLRIDHTGRLTPTTHPPCSGFFFFFKCSDVPEITLVLRKACLGGEEGGVCEPVSRGARFLSCSLTSILPALADGALFPLADEPQWGFLGTLLLWPSQYLAPGMGFCTRLGSGDGLLFPSLPIRSLFFCCSFRFFMSRWAICTAAAIVSWESAEKWKPSVAAVSPCCPAWVPVGSPLCRLASWAIGKPLQEGAAAARSMVMGRGWRKCVARLCVVSGMFMLNCSWFWNITSWGIAISASEMEIGILASYSTTKVNKKYIVTLTERDEYGFRLAAAESSSIPFQKWKMTLSWTDIYVKGPNSNMRCYTGMPNISSHTGAAPIWEKMSISYQVAPVYIMVIPMCDSLFQLVSVTW